MKLETGDLIMEKGTGIIDWGVKKVTNSEYSHVALVYDYPLIIQSHLLSGVHITNIDEIGEYDVYRYKGGLSKSQKKIVKESSIQYLGIDYDLFQIFGYLWTAIFEGRNKFNNPNLIICSELVDLVYNKLKIYILRDRFLGDITPEEVINPKLFDKIIDG